MKPPDHPILAAPWEYSIVDLHWHHDLEHEHSYLDITLAKEDDIRCLRFVDPRDLRIDEGFPSSSGLCILDVSDLQWEDLRIQVSSFESSSGQPRFHAWAVHEIPKRLAR